MKPHRVSDLLTAMYQRTNPSYGPGRQKNEWMEVLESVGIRPEHGNRGEERETTVLVTLQELEALRSEVERLKAAPVVVPELTLDDVRGFIREWLSQPLEERGPALPGCPQAELALRKGYTLAASRLRTIGPGEVVVSEKELNVLLILERYARKHGPESIDYAIEALDALRSQKEGGAT